MPFAPIWASAADSCTWRAIEDETEYLQLRRWLASVSSLDIQWPDQASWLSDPPTTPVIATHKRVCMVGVLAALLPTPVPLGDERLRTKLLPLRSDEPQLPSTLAKLERGRVKIYKAIRRQFARRLGVRVSASVSDDGNRRVWISDTAMMMPTRQATDSRRFGFNAWRARFEVSFGQRVGLELRSDQLLWPGDWCASDQAWGHFVHQSLILDLAMSSALNRALAGLDGDKDEDRPAWLEIVGDWRRRFDTFSRAWPDGLTVLRLAMPSESGQACLIAVEPACVLDA